MFDVIRQDETLAFDFQSQFARLDLRVIGYLLTVLYTECDPLFIWGEMWVQLHSYFYFWYEIVSDYSENVYGPLTK